MRAQASLPPSTVEFQPDARRPAHLHALLDPELRSAVGRACRNARSRRQRRPRPSRSPDPRRTDFPARTCGHGRRCRDAPSRGNRHRLKRRRRSLLRGESSIQAALSSRSVAAALQAGDRNGHVGHAGRPQRHAMVLEADLMRRRGQGRRRRIRIGSRAAAAPAASPGRTRRRWRHRAWLTAQRTGPMFSSSTKMPARSSPASSASAIAEPTVGWPANGIS